MNEYATGEKSPQLLVSVYLRLINSHVLCFGSYSSSSEHYSCGLKHGLMRSQQTQLTLIKFRVAIIKCTETIVCKASKGISSRDMLKGCKGTFRLVRKCYANL